jgi:hypothetical protein
MIQPTFAPVDLLVEQMGEALFNLSDSLRAARFFENKEDADRYEAVVAAWRGLTNELAKSQGSA